MMMWGIFPNLPPVPSHEPTLGLVRRPDIPGSPGASCFRRKGTVDRHIGVQERRVRRLAEGLCEKCGKPRERSHVSRCEACLESHRESARKSARARRAAS